MFEKKDIKTKIERYEKLFEAMIYKTNGPCVDSDVEQRLRREYRELKRELEILELKERVKELEAIIKQQQNTIRKQGV